MLVCLLWLSLIVTLYCHAVFLVVEQHHIQQGSLEAGFSLLLQHLPHISNSSSSAAGLSAACVGPWLSLLVAAAAAGQAALHAQVSEVLGQWAQGHAQHIDMAWVSDDVAFIHELQVIHRKLCPFREPTRGSFSWQHVFVRVLKSQLI